MTMKKVVIALTLVKSDSCRLTVDLNL